MRSTQIYVSYKQTIQGTGSEETKGSSNHRREDKGSTRHVQHSLPSDSGCEARGTPLSTPSHSHSQSGNHLRVQNIQQEEYPSIQKVTRLDPFVAMYRNTNTLSFHNHCLKQSSVAFQPHVFVKQLNSHELV